eukprot:m.17713 g.17713  ORF g.17713 m.17713 type:complete len:439 (+) comp27542_c0_seq1:111-1427(+)
MESDDEVEESVGSLLGKGRPPPDRFNLVYWIFYVQGIGTLLPWNMFITANDYFQQKFANVTDENVTAPGKFEHNFENFFEVGFMVPNLTFLALNVIFKHRFSVRLRILGSLFIILVGFIVTVCLIFPDSYSWQNSFFAITILVVAFVAIGGATYQSGIYGLAGMFDDHKYTSAIMGGQGLAGIFASLAAIFSLLGGNDYKDSAIGYFACAVAVILLAIVTFFLLSRLKFSQFYIEVNQASMDTVVQDQEAKDDQKKESPNFLFIFKRIWKPALSVYLVFFVSLTVFPAVASNIKSVAKDPSASPWTSTYFTPVTCFLLFNVGDFTGRTIAVWIPFISAKWLWVPSLLRFAFIPLFALCNTSAHNPSTVLMSDAFPVVFMALMALSNGYLSTLAMMYGPGLVPDKDKETAGTMMAFFLGGGLVSGSAFSFAVTEIMKKV